MTIMDCQNQQKKSLRPLLMRRAPDDVTKVPESTILRRKEMGVLYEVIGVNVGCGLCHILHMLDGDKHFNMLIDSGPANGLSAVKTILKNYCGGRETPDAVIISHPDGDHINGLREMLKDKTTCQDLKKVIWIDYDQVLKDAGMDLRTIDNEGIKESVGLQREVSDLMKKMGVAQEPILPPKSYNCFGLGVEILGPPADFVKEQLEMPPEPPEWIEQKPLFKEAKESKPKNWIEALDEKEESKAENLLSLIIRITGFDNRVFLLPGDGGPASFNKVGDCKKLSQPYWFSVPHHGSRMNLNSKLIRHIAPSNAFISWGPDDDDHPHWSVVEGLRSTNAGVFFTGLNKSSLFAGTIRREFNAYKSCSVKNRKVVLE